MLLRYYLLFALVATCMARPHLAARQENTDVESAPPPTPTPGDNTPSPTEPFPEPSPPSTPTPSPGEDTGDDPPTTPNPPETPSPGTPNPPGGGETPTPSPGGETPPGDKNYPPATDYDGQCTLSCESQPEHYTNSTSGVYCSKCWANYEGVPRRNVWLGGFSCKSTEEIESLEDADGRPGICTQSGGSPQSYACYDTCNALLQLASGNDPCRKVVIDTWGACRVCDGGQGPRGGPLYGGSFTAFGDKLAQWCSAKRCIDIRTGQRTSGSNCPANPPAGGGSTTPAPGSGGGTRPVGGNGNGRASTVIDSAGRPIATVVRDENGAVRSQVVEVSTTDDSGRPTLELITSGLVDGTFVPNTRLGQPAPTSSPADSAAKATAHLSWVAGALSAMTILLVCRLG